MPRLSSSARRSSPGLVAIVLLSLGCQSDRATSPPSPGAANSSVTAPTKPRVRVTIASLVLSPTAMTLEGGAILYRITLSNSGNADATGVSIQSQIQQGNGISRSGSSVDASCGGNAGVVPVGQCSMDVTASASNSATGTGTLVPGSAKITIAVNQSDGTTRKQLDFKTLRTAIVAETHVAPYMSDVLIDFGSLQLDNFPIDPNYTVTVFNPTGTDQSSYGIQAVVNQGNVTQSAGGTLVLCFPNNANPGTIPPGSCTFRNTTGTSSAPTLNGSLVAGAAIWHLDFFYSDGSSDTTVGSRNFNITLTGP